MLFTDPIFLFYFLPIALFINWLAVGGNDVVIGAQYPRPAQLGIFLLTLIFYGFSTPWWLLPFLACVVMDSFWGRSLAKCRNHKLRSIILAASIIQNLGLLFFFKYSNFVGQISHALFPALAIQLPTFHSIAPGLLLPAGISFYTFESLSYVIDIYRREIKPPKSNLQFYAFIAMFPRFIAGPIVRYRQVAEQIQLYQGMDISNGFVLFARGLFLKACFADCFAEFVPFAFGQASSPNIFAAWIGVGSFMMNLYFDFQGYSLMAMGLGKCLGFNFPANFSCPYLADSMQEFWRRWHITLSAWLRDYLYFPLGGSQKGPLRTYLNIFLTMLAAGIWHGSGWTFVAWGAWNGFWLCFERAFRVEHFLPKYLRHGLTLICIATGLTFFNGARLGESFRILRAMFDLTTLSEFNAASLAVKPLSLGLALLGLVYCFVVEPLAQRNLRLDDYINGYLISMGQFALSLTLTFSSRTIPFLYFQF